MNRPDGTASTAEVLATLRNSGWTDEDLQASPLTAAPLNEEGHS